MRDLYNSLAIFVRSPQWQTNLIRFQFQGGPRSVTIFLSSISMLTLSLNLLIDLLPMSSPMPIAACCNTCLVTSSVSYCQYLCKISHKFFNWACMKVNVAKCQTLAILVRGTPRCSILGYFSPIRPSLLLAPQSSNFWDYHSTYGYQITLWG